MTESSENFRRTLICLGVGGLTGVLFLAGALRSPWMGLGAVLSVAGMLFLIRAPGIGLGVLTFLIPLERMQRITNDNATYTLSIMRLVAMACLGAIFLARIHQRRSLRLDRSMFLYFVYVLLATAALGYSSDPTNTKRALGTIFSNCLFLFLYYNYFENRRQIHQMIAVWLFATVVGAAYTTYDWNLGSGRAGAVKLTDPGQGTQTTVNRWSTVWEDITEWDAQGGAALRRSMGPTSHPAVYGINLMMTVPFFFYLLRRHRKMWQQAIIAAALGLIFYNILLTNTRAVLVGAGITVALCIAYGFFKFRRSHLLVTLVAVAVLVPFIPRDTIERMLDPNNYLSSKATTLQIRMRYWDAAVRIIQERPLFGLGVGNEKDLPSYVEGEDAHIPSVHNIFLQVAVETGLLGWLAFFGFVGLLFSYAVWGARESARRPGWEAENDLFRAIQIGMIVVLFFGVQVDVFNFPLKGWWLMAIVAVTMHRWLRAEARPAEAVSTDFPPAWNSIPAR